MKVPSYPLAVLCLIAMAPAFAQTTETPAETPAEPAASAEATAETTAPPAAEPVAEPAKPAAPAKAKAATTTKRKVRPAAPRYRWAELDYRTRYIGDGDDRLRSPFGLALSTNLLIVPNLYFVGGFGQDEFDTGGSIGTIDVKADFTVQEWNLGFGGYLPVTPSTHLFLNGTYESATVDFDFTVTDSANPGNNSSSSAEAEGAGYGLQLGVRTMLSASAELAASYKRTEIEGDVSDSSDEFESAADIFAVQLATRITPELDLVFRLQHSGSDDTDHEDTDGDGRTDTTTESRGRDEQYGVGLRLRF